MTSLSLNPSNPYPQHKMQGSHLTIDGRVEPIDCSLWQDRQITSVTVTPEIGRYTIPIMNIQSLTSLNLSHCTDFSDLLLTPILSYCPNLQVLNLSGCTQITDEGLNQIAPENSSLTMLDISDCPQITEAAVKALKQSLPQLKVKFPVKTCTPVSEDWPKGLNGLIAAYLTSPQREGFIRETKPPVTVDADAYLKQNLKIVRQNILRDGGTLSIEDVKQLLVDNFELFKTTPFKLEIDIPIQTLQVILDNCPHITSIRIEPNLKNALNTEQVIAIAQRYPKLQSLSLINCSQITDPAIVAIAQECPELTSLDLTKCCLIEEPAIIPLAERCPSLTSLNLSFCYKLRSPAITAIARGCPHLQFLDLSDCPQIYDDAINAIAQNCPTLKSLHLWRSPIEGRSIIAIAEGCPFLESLNLGGTHIKDSDILSALEKGGLTCLQDLRLSGCVKITDAALIAIAPRCPHLQHLDISSCEYIGDAALIAIAKGCPHIQSLNLKECYGITDAGLTAIAKGCPRLQSLSLKMCNKITDEGINTVLETRPDIALDLP